jgi:hypothetical protein
MATPHLTLLFLIVCVVFVHSRADLAVGTRCLLQDYSRGVCKNIRSCSVVMEQIKSGSQITPSICSRAERTVCCPFESPVRVVPAVDVEPETTTAAAAVEMTPLELTVKSKKRISEQSEMSEKFNNMTHILITYQIHKQTRISRQFS